MISHPIPPVWNKNSKILILGSFPSVKSREEGFFYGHPRNRFWSVLSQLFEEPFPENINEKKKLLLTHKISLWDVIASCEITGSADSAIKTAVPNDISDIINTAKIKRIFLNGRTAASLYSRYMAETVNIEAVYLPSTSPANASWTTEKLKKAWSEILNV